MSHEEILQLQEEIKTLQLENRHLKDALKQAQATQAPSLVARLQEEIVQLRQQMQDRNNNERESKEKPVSGPIKSTFQDLQTQVARLKDRTEAIKNTLEPEKAPTFELIQQLGAKVLSLHEEMKHVTRVHKRQQREATRKVKAAQESEKAIEVLVKTLGKQILAVSKENHSLKKHIEDSENIYAGVVSKLEAQLKEAKTSQEQTQQSVREQYETQISSLQEQLEKEQKARKEAAKKIVTLAHQLKDNSLEYDTLSQKLFDLRMQHAEAHQEREELKNKQEELKQTIQHLEQQLAILQQAAKQKAPEKKTTSQNAPEDPFRSLNIFEI